MLAVRFSSLYYAGTTRFINTLVLRIFVSKFEIYVVVFYWLNEQRWWTYGIWRNDNSAKIFGIRIMRPKSVSFSCPIGIFVVHITSNFNKKSSLEIDLVQKKIFFF